MEDMERDAEKAEEILRIVAKVSSSREDEKAAAAKESVGGRSHNFRTRRSLLQGKPSTEEPPSTRAPELNPGAVSVQGPGRRQRIEDDNESSTAAQSIEDDEVLERQGGLLVASVVDEEETTKLIEELEEKKTRLREVEQSLQTMRSSTNEVTTAIPVTTKQQPQLTDAEQAALEFLLGDKSDIPDTEKSACCVVS